MVTRTLTAVEVAYARRASGNFVINSVTWIDLTSAMDLVLAAQTGDFIQVAASGFWNNDGLFSYLDVATIVSATPVTYVSSGTGTPAADGIVGWSGSSGAFVTIGGPAMFTVGAGDLASGQVTLRLRTRTSAASNKTLYAQADDPLFFSAVNLGP